MLKTRSSGGNLYHFLTYCLSSNIQVVIFKSCVADQIKKTHGHPLESVLIAQSCLTLCNLMDCSLPGSSVHWIPQARILEWGAIPFPRDPLEAHRWPWTFWRWAECHSRRAVGPLLGLCFPSQVDWAHFWFMLRMNMHMSSTDYVFHIKRCREKKGHIFLHAVAFTRGTFVRDTGSVHNSLWDQNMFVVIAATVIFCSKFPQMVPLFYFLASVSGKRKSGRLSLILIGFCRPV